MTHSFTFPVRSGHDHASVSLEECYLFTRQLHVLQRAGVPLLSSLQALQTQVASASFRRVLVDVHHALLEGRKFSQALERHPAVFSPMFVSLIRVGEAGGLLDEVLKELSQLLQWEMDLRHRLKDALQYPCIVLATLSVALLIMAVFVLPRFGQMFQSFHIPLPLQTRILIVLSLFLARYGWLLALILIAAAIGWWRYLSTPAGRFHWDTWKLHLPIVGPAVLQLSMSRFARVTAALTHSGVPILETLALASETTNNRYVQIKLESVRSRIRAGESLATALKREPLFPSVVVQMVATGEETGRLDELLHSVSDYYDDQVNYYVKRLITSLEPALLIVVGLGVLAMASAIFVPMWDLVKIFKQGR